MEFVAWFERVVRGKRGDGAEEGFVVFWEGLEV